MARGAKTAAGSPGTEKEPQGSAPETGAAPPVTALEKTPKERARRGKPVVNDPVFDEVVDFMAKTVLRARKDMGLTQLELSRKCEFNATAVFMVESRDQNMTLRGLVTLASTLGLQVGDLFPRSTARTGAKLRELAEVIEDVGGRIGTHTRALERIARELREEGNE
jgi:ribosome-binding protein aMBF1 (putative translation factor)